MSARWQIDVDSVGSRFDENKWKIHLRRWNFISKPAVWRDFVWFHFKISFPLLCLFLKQRKKESECGSWKRNRKWLVMTLDSSVYIARWKHEQWREALPYFRPPFTKQKVWCNCDGFMNGQRTRRELLYSPQLVMRQRCEIPSRFIKSHKR